MRQRGESGPTFPIVSSVRAAIPHRLADLAAPVALPVAVQVARGGAIAFMVAAKLANVGVPCCSRPWSMP